jgi:hypothetical protein
MKTLEISKVAFKVYEEEGIIEVTISTDTNKIVKQLSIKNNYYLKIDNQTIYVADIFTHVKSLHGLDIFLKQLMTSATTVIESETKEKLPF